jgi:8-oxo-dGTP diphosphatase
MTIEVGVKALIQNSSGSYLVLKRTHPYPGESEPRWDVPGGRIIPGETLTDGLRREIKEETGLRMQGTPQIIHAQDILRVKDKHTVRLTFVTKAKGKLVLSPEEHTEFVWASLAKMKKMHIDMFLTPVLELLESSPKSRRNL